MPDPVIHQATRLRIVATLHRNREMGFVALRDALGLTEGNLGSHAARLVEAGYVEARRVLAGLSFELRYRLTAKGSAAFEAYLAELERFLAEAGRPVSGAEGSRHVG
jgi:DNA-binding MarR family transcriptional regulator